MGDIMSIFKPLMYKKSIFDINYDKLKDKNIKIIVMDLDNTIATVKEKTAKKEVRELFNKLSTDFKLVIASNNFKKRVSIMCDNLPCDYFYNLCKPFKKLKKLLIKKYHVNMNEVCIIGDQIVTDIFLANRIGALSVLVDPLGEKDLKITRLNRFIEKRIIKKIKFKKGEYYDEV